ncbi:MAG: hypothetical protein HGB19_02130 [Chlorobiales bacterium]|nr:hypothetical protein [Chlorobiales bacterium]
MSVKFQLASREMPLIIVPVMVSGAKASRITMAIVDTGATGCVLTEALADEIGAKHLEVPKSEKDAHGIGGKMSVEFVKVKEICLDKAVSRNLKVAVMDMSQIKEQFKIARVPKKRDAELILGYTFFKDHQLKIDYKTKVLSIQPSTRGK